MRESAAVILAGGRGTRMGSARPKILHELAGLALICYPVEVCLRAGIQTIYVVAGDAAAEVEALLGDMVVHLYQREPLGTGHALQIAAPVLRDLQGDLLVLMGDAPFVDPELLQALLARRRSNGAGAALVTGIFQETPPYGRIIRDRQGRIVEIVEEALCTPEQKAIEEVFTAPYCFCAQTLLPLLEEISINSRKGEYFLTDIVSILARHGHAVSALRAPDPRRTRGLNTPQDFRWAERFIAELVKSSIARGSSLL